MLKSEYKKKITHFAETELGLSYEAFMDMFASDLAAVNRENARLKAVLAGDPDQTATQDQREEWRLSAVRYADRLQSRVTELEEERKACRDGQKEQS